MPCSVVRHSAITPRGCLRNEKRAASETAILHYRMRAWRVGQRHDLMRGRLDGPPGVNLRTNVATAFRLVIARTANRSNKIDFAGMSDCVWLIR